MSRTTLPNSTYLDLTSYQTTLATTPEGAYNLNPPTLSTMTLNVALILPRANDPSALLSSDWATRQATLAELQSSGTLWTTYGANQSDYTAALAELQHLGITVLGDAQGSGGYITSAESRTIWVQLSPTQFTTLFDQALYGIYPDLQYWHDELSLPDTIKATGIWLDAQPIWGTYPATSDLGGQPALLPQGLQSIGNGLSQSGFSKDFTGDMAQWFYKFPLAGKDVPTETLGLVEPEIGDALPPNVKYTFQQGLDSFRSLAGYGSGTYYSVANNGLNYDDGNSLERSLDIGVVASAAPGSTIGLYGGSGTGNNANSNAFTAYQASFWDQVNNPGVVSSSFDIFQQTAPDSPFRRAVDELFIDAALRNITVFAANNDWGSSYNFPTGLAHQNITHSSPYIVLVGGTSVTTMETAPHDPSVYDPSAPLQSLYGQALDGNLSTLWLLIEGGLATLPTKATGPDARENMFLEAVWNIYAIDDTTMDPGVIGNFGASNGGVDITRPTPSYQAAFGLTPTTVNPGGGTGRGAPDVAANAGGNMMSYGPPSTMAPGSYADLGYYDGTSASTPLWASLAAQIDAVFNDQGLPNLGYANDLLYTAAAIAPASFNDIELGNNTSSYQYGGDIDSDGTFISLTGLGYNAGPSYDLTTGLGSPNGTILTRTLSAIAHAQTSFADDPAVLDSNGSGGWASGDSQSLLVQTISSVATTVTVTNGSHDLPTTSDATSHFAWTSQFAQQSLQADFDPALVRLFDQHAQGALMPVLVADGNAFAVKIGGTVTTTPQAGLTNDFGFVDFADLSSGSTVHVARDVAVAQTAGGQDDQLAVVRIRQNGVDELSLTLFRVDDLTGTIGSLHPGDTGYAAAAATRAYKTTDGDSAIGGPGYGNFKQVLIDDVDAGDLIALKLTNQSTGNVFWSFAEANEVGKDGNHVGHLWNYDLNTWGFEDKFEGGDRDFNDMVIGVDFTSAAGHGWTV